MTPRQKIEYRECMIVVSLWVDKWIINYIVGPKGTVHVKPFLHLDFPNRDAAVEKGKKVIDASFQASEPKPITQIMLKNL